MYYWTKGADDITSREKEGGWQKKKYMYMDDLIGDLKNGDG